MSTTAADATYKQKVLELEKVVADCVLRLERLEKAAKQTNREDVQRAVTGED